MIYLWDQTPIKPSRESTEYSYSKSLEDVSVKDQGSSTSLGQTINVTEF